MEPKIEEIWVDSSRAMNAAQLEVTCCNETHSVSINDFDNMWTCPKCNQTLKFSFGGIKFTVVDKV